MNVDQKIQHRRAIEALRSGVPNRDAVLALGCKQPTIEEKFRAQLQAAKEGLIFWQSGQEGPSTSLN